MSTALIPMSDIQRMAQAVAASKLFGVTNVEQALALMLVAQAEGLHPATAARDYHIIQGRPALKADAMLARYLNSGGKVEWVEHTDAKVEAKFTHPAGGSVTIDWDMERAKKAGLGGKDMWAKYPRQMLRARVISEGIRATNPAVVSGVYTPEEMQDMEPAKPARRGRTSPPPPSGSDPSAPAERDITDESEVLKAAPEQIEAMKKALAENDVDILALLMKAELGDIAEMPASDVPGAIRWIKAQKKAA
jgi:hypothetical protein